MMKITEPSIAKEKFRWSSEVKQKLSYQKWIDFIESHKEYFIWQEDTEEGKNTLANLHEVPESFKEGILKGHNKSRAFAEFNNKKGFYEVYVDFNERYGTISTTFQKKIERRHLELLLEMANHLDALLLVDGTKVINEETLRDFV